MKAEGGLSRGRDTTAGLALVQRYDNDVESINQNTLI